MYGKVGTDMELLKIMKSRRSVRKYIDEKIPEELLLKVIDAGLLSASGRGYRPWELIVVRDKVTLEKLSKCREGAAKMLEGAGAAVVVLGNPEISDTWIEDCSIVMSNMHLMADSIGLGSCWIQGRMRKSPEEISTEEYVRNVLSFPDKLRLEAILSLGMIQNHPEENEIYEKVREKVHFEKW